MNKLLKLTILLLFSVSLLTQQILAFDPEQTVEAKKNQGETELSTEDEDIEEAENTEEKEEETSNLPKTSEGIVIKGNLEEESE